MSKSLIIGTVLGVAVATAGGVFAGYQFLKGDERPELLVVAPAAVAAAPAPFECVPQDPRDENRIAGTVIGALVGGAVGKDVGDRDITTAAGAAAGALAGNQIQKRVQENRTERTAC